MLMGNSIFINSCYAIFTCISVLDPHHARDLALLSILTADHD
jgi:hypothetical protein